MGARGAGGFENDDATDWVIELAAGSGDAVLRDALVSVASAGDRYLEAPDCSVAIAGGGSRSGGKRSSERVAARVGRRMSAATMRRISGLRTISE